MPPSVTGHSGGRNHDGGLSERYVEGLRMKRGIIASVLLMVQLLTPPADAGTNDPLWPYQWGVHRIRAEQAWPTARGNGVTVAVVDSGVDVHHEDLAGRLVLGPDFVDGGWPQDGSGHGTFVTGIVGAATGNGRGIGGVAPGARILAVRVLGPDGKGTAADLVAGVKAAADAGADVINLSVSSSDLFVYALVPELDDAVYYAWLRGAVVVVAAGNDGDSFCRAPGFSPFAICVGATNRFDRHSAFSNSGLRVDVVAPGEDIHSTYYDPGLPTRHDLYGTGKGTSFAAPFVSGAAALVMGMGATNVQAARVIRCFARDLGAGGYDLTYGWGLVDAAAAVQAFRTGSYLLEAC